MFWQICPFFSIVGLFWGFYHLTSGKIVRVTINFHQLNILATETVCIKVEIVKLFFRKWQALKQQFFQHFLISGIFRSDFLPWRWRHGKSLMRLFLYYKFHVYSKYVIRFWLALWDCAKKTLCCRMLKIELSTPFENFKQSSQ